MKKCKKKGSKNVFFFFKKKKREFATWHIGPPCVLRVIVSRRHASSRQCSCAGTRETNLFPVQRIDKEGRDASDFSSGELRNTTRRLHLPSPFG